MTRRRRCATVVGATHPMSELIEAFVWVVVIATVLVLGAAWLLLRFLRAVLVAVCATVRARA